MNLTWTCVVLSLLVFTTGLPENQIKEFIALTKYGYEDSCSKAAQSEWSFINEPTNETRLEWENATSEYALYKIKQVNETSIQNVEDFPYSSLEYAYDVVIKPGDALLEIHHFNELVSFAGQAELSRLSGYFETGSKKNYRQDVEQQLSRNGKPGEKLSCWTSWHQTLLPLAAHFSHSLQLVGKAAEANGKNGVLSYWEMLSSYDNGYDHAKQEWLKISSVHKKIVDFVKKRLNRKYSDAIENNTLPAHLLGSLQGYDWTNLVMDVAPYSDVSYNIRKNLWEEKFVGKKLYQEASKLGQILLRHVPQADFWKESNFRGQCPSHLINLCKDGKMRISTCSEASVANFISAHKNVAKILATQMSHHAEPILSVANRYSALEEAVAELFGVLSVSQAWLNSRDLIDNSTDLDQAHIVSLMITALDVLPRMAYYLAADNWRIDATENRTFDGSDMATSWWNYRMKYEGISTSVPDIPTFMNDDYITSNKPYLPKFLGTILGFQLYEYLMESTEMRYETISSSTGNHHLAKMIRVGFADDWSKVMKKYLEMDEINADALLSYFSPLVDYIDEQEEMNEDFPLPEEQEKELDSIGDEYRKTLNAPSTTTTTTMKPAVTRTTTRKPMTPKPSRKSSANNAPQTMEPAKSWLSDESSKNSTSSRDVEIAPANEKKEIPIESEAAQSEGAGINDEKPKPNTSKAVWAVAAVLVATITICIIAIFGRRRCRKAPKNRRYV
ncbi:angiotensin-converting enzyme-like [Venturia canescens]|uniref:angiotensin-converting enzyme-like n=1 Tax=Venturia canescens TaxID=32260 RepID=UPI001C9BE77F|nr:angiotensin-converting enzyme-like [Venturia canescens]XP_043267788.1 angiotensin-converting enzyme-like [Venturia canescens]